MRRRANRVNRSTAAQKKKIANFSPGEVDRIIGNPGALEKVAKILGTNAEGARRYLGNLRAIKNRAVSWETVSQKKAEKRAGYAERPNDSSGGFW